MLAKQPWELLGRGSVQSSRDGTIRDPGARQDLRLMDIPLSLGCCFYSLMMDLQGNKDIRVGSSTLGD